MKSLRDKFLESAQHLNLENVKASLRKPDIARKITEYYVDEDLFSEDDLAQFPDPSAKKPMSETQAKIQLMQLEIERERINREADRLKLETLDKQRIAEREAREAEKEAREAREREREADRIAKKAAREA